MPNWLAIGLVTLAVLAVAVRLWTRARRSNRRGGDLAGGDTAMVVAGIVGLVLHCAAMFYPGLVTALPGGRTYATVVNGMGLGSAVLFVLPAALLLIGLRTQRRLATIALALALLAVGVTMYDCGPLPVHLAAITASAVVLACIVAFGTSSDSRRVREAGPAR